MGIIELQMVFLMKIRITLLFILDYDNNVLDDENNYSEYNGYKLIEEVDSKLFYTDEYSYFQEKYCQKSFNNTIEFDIPFNYFEHIYSVTPNFTIIKFIAGQQYKDKNNIVSIYEIRSTEIEFNFSFNEDEKMIKIEF